MSRFDSLELIYFAKRVREFKVPPPLDKFVLFAESRTNDTHITKTSLNPLEVEFSDRSVKQLHLIDLVFIRSYFMQRDTKIQNMTCL